MTTAEIILDVGFSTRGFEATIESLLRMAEVGEGCPRWFACVNPHSVEVARRDAGFRKASENADLVTADGAGIVLASKILGGQVRERVCGPDIFCMLCARLNAAKVGTRMFFMGTDEVTLAALKEKFEREFSFRRSVCFGYGAQTNYRLWI